MERKIEGKHVLFMLLGFFGVMITVNMVFVYFALTSFSGLSFEDAYKRGAAYNKEISTAQEQAARGWNSDIVFEALGDKRGAILLKLVDKNGAKITGVEVTAILRRPVGPYTPHSQQMVMAPGGLETEITFEHEGQWDLVFDVKGGGYDRPYRLEKRIWVK